MLFVSKPAMAGVLANLVFLALLLHSVVQIGRSAFNLGAGVAAALVAGAYPLLAQFQHEAFVDFALTGMTSWCVWRLLATDGFRKRRAALGWGVSVGLGLLVKQLLPLYLLGPCVALLWSHRRTMNREAWRNTALAAGAAALCALPWFALHWRAVLETARFNQRIAAVEGDPTPWSLAGALFYPHAIASLEVGFLPFVIAIVAGVCLVATLVGKRAGRSSQRSAQVAILAWLAGGLLLLTFVVLNKDARYSLPVLPALALVTASPLSWIRGRTARVVFLLLLTAALIPYYTHIEFDWPPIRQSAGFRTGPLFWMLWNKSYYYSSAPSQENWGIPDLLVRMEAERGEVTPDRPVRLALVPFLLRVNDNSLRLEAIRWKVLLEVFQIGNDPEFAAEGHLPSCDFLFTKTGDTGLSFETSQAKRIQGFVQDNPGRFQLLETYPLPDGSDGALYRIVR
jgi:4-amino-4-deoxy-L-arabinose transferase-like glycosyltransferase